MPIWSTEYLNRLTLEAEIEIAKKVPCIVERYSLIVEAGTSEYQLPLYINNIKKILYKGNRLEPVSHNEFSNWIYTFDSKSLGAFHKNSFNNNAFHVFEIDSIDINTLGAFEIEGFQGTAFFVFENLSPQVDELNINTSQGIPTRYFYSKMGENVIRLNPSPNENIEIFDSLYSTNIANSVIIEYYAIPDGITVKIPEYIRKRTIKSYVLWKAFLKEGIGQNLQASEFHKQRYEIQLLRAERIIKNIYSAQLNSRESELYRYGKMPARPVLPANYGIVVEDEE